jgi:hypothetical protein
MTMCGPTLAGLSKYAARDAITLEKAVAPQRRRERRGKTISCVHPRAHTRGEYGWLDNLLKNRLSLCLCVSVVRFEG